MAAARAPMFGTLSPLDVECLAALLRFLVGSCTCCLPLSIEPSMATVSYHDKGPVMRFRPAYLRLRDIFNWVRMI